MIKKFILPILTLSVLASCGGGQSTEKPAAGEEKLSGSITIDGSSTVYPITEAVAEDFNTANADVKITAAMSGTGGGFKKFARKEIDICNASRPIKDEEKAACAESGVQYTEFLVAYDGLAVVVNKENTWVDYLTTEELKKIWSPESQGKITKWSQVRKGWPDEKLTLMGPGTASGTFDYFTEVINGEKGACRGDYTASEDDNVLVQGVSNDKSALGFFGMAYYEENVDKLKEVPVDDMKDENGKGPFSPNKETVKDGSYSPLSRPLLVYVNNEAFKRPEVRAFMEFYLEKAGVLSEEVGYVALNADEYTTEKKKLPAKAEAAPAH